MTSKRLFHIFVAATVLLPLAAVLAQAQSRRDTPKIEVGAQLVVTRLRDLDETNAGAGGRITYNFTDNIAIDGELTYFPQDLGSIAATSSYQGLFGVKTGWRSEKAGIFGKIRPGFIRFDRVSPLLTSTQLAFDLGGVFELYPSRRTVVRFDIGNTIINFGSDLATPSFTSHNLQFGVGFGYRF
jgi:Outer membrane protein beta-barrel domain